MSAGAAAICSCPGIADKMIRSTAASFRRLSLLLGATAAFSRLAAQDSSAVVLPDYVLTATRTPAALTTTGTAVDVISAADLARMQLTSLQSALTGVPGTPASASGAPGGVTSLFLRGANSNQTLFLVDGIRLGQLAQQAKRRPQWLIDRCGVEIGEDGGDLVRIAVPLARSGGVRGDAERRRIGEGDVGRHEFTLADRPLRWSAHGLVGESACAVEVLAVQRELDGVDHRLA